MTEHIFQEQIDKDIAILFGSQKSSFLEDGVTLETL